MKSIRSPKVRTINGVKLIHPDFVIKAYDNKGEYEPDAFQIWNELALQGKTMVDVGMYTGIYSIKAALQGSRVVGFEPNPYVFRQAEANIFLNEVRDMVTAHNKGLMNTVGLVQFYINPSKLITSAGSFAPKYNLSANKGFEVDVQKLDNFQLTNVAGIKIDAERSEFDVIKGGLKTIERDHPSLIVELLDADHFEETNSLLRSLGYARENLRHCLYHFHF